LSRWDVLPEEARELERLVNQLAYKKELSADDTEALKAKALLSRMAHRRYETPMTLPVQFVLIRMCRPVTGYENIFAGQKKMNAFLYTDYGCHPIRHLSGWASKWSGGSKSVFAYVVENNRVREIPPDCGYRYALHVGWAFPIQEPIYLPEHFIDCGPYTDACCYARFHENPSSVMCVKRNHSLAPYSAYTKNVRVFARWVLKLKPPFGTLASEV